jgi:diketogulonate reductase-like aldo/keto reductase
MSATEAFRQSRIALTHGSGAIPVVGFGTLIPDLAATTQATATALEVGFRHFDGAERYRNEHAEISPLPDDAMSEIRDHITTNIRFNSVVQTGVPGFIPRPA